MPVIVTTISRRYHFESAHWLPNVPENHRCRNMHGHNYELEVTISGPVHDDGFVIDFWDIDTIVQPIISKIDHMVLNNIEGLENPTAELIAAWFINKLNPRPIGNYFIPKVQLWETKDCSAVVKFMDF